MVEPDGLCLSLYGRLTSRAKDVGIFLWDPTVVS